MLVYVCVCVLSILLVLLLFYFYVVVNAIVSTLLSSATATSIMLFLANTAWALKRFEVKCVAQGR
jgi:hypothetical protein